jgi:hypothetical protein
MNNNGNIFLNQIVVEGSVFAFKETIPFYEASDKPQALIRLGTSELLWTPVDLSLNLKINEQFQNIHLYVDNGRVGLGRFPLFNYKVDIAVPRDTLMTALHVGDGSFGFSMGNGTTQGFIPEIIGIGSDENDTGLYFVGIAGNDVSSDIPLIILDGRNAYNRKLTNRPILGITSGDYNNYVVLVDAFGNVKINGISFSETIRDLQKQIDDLKIQISK